MESINRLKVLENQVLSGSFVSKENSNAFTSQVMIGDETKKYPEIIDNHPERKTKLDYINKQGWGYQDTYFYFEEKSNMGALSGNRYDSSGKVFPGLKPWVEAETGMNFENIAPK